MQVAGSGSFNNVYSSGTSCIGKGLLPGFDPKMVPPQFFDRVTEKGSSYCFKGPVSIQTTNDQTTVTFLDTMARLSPIKTGIQLGVGMSLGGITFMLATGFCFEALLPRDQHPSDSPYTFFEWVALCTSGMMGITVALLTYHVTGKIFDRYL